MQEEETFMYIIANAEVISINYGFKFIGINKYNPQAYSKTFQFIHNSRQIDSKEERLEQILWYK